MVGLFVLNMTEDGSYALVPMATLCNLGEQYIDRVGRERDVHPRPVSVDVEGVVDHILVFLARQRQRP